MRKLLIGTFAALATALPAMAQEQQAPEVAPTVPIQPRPSDSRAYLVLIGRLGASMIVIPTRDLAQCEEQGAVYMASERMRLNGQYKGYECFEGVK